MPLSLNQFAPTSKERLGNSHLKTNCQTFRFCKVHKRKIITVRNFHLNKMEHWLSSKDIANLFRTTKNTTSFSLVHLIRQDFSSYQFEVISMIYRKTRLDVYLGALEKLDFGHLTNLIKEQLPGTALFFLLKSVSRRKQVSYRLLKYRYQGGNKCHIVF